VIRAAVIIKKHVPPLFDPMALNGNFFQYCWLFRKSFRNLVWIEQVLKARTAA
jgi:hypothetical protein